MAKLYGYAELTRNKANNKKRCGCDYDVVFNNIFWLCGLIVTVDAAGVFDLPNLYSFTIAFLLITWSMIIANIYASQTFTCRFSPGAKSEWARKIAKSSDNIIQKVLKTHSYGVI